MPLESGHELGPYEIVAPLGAGGMGEVYEARDTRLDRRVAIKVLPEELASDEVHRRRLEREARAVAALDHPHILTIHDVGIEGETVFVVYEFLDGATLRERLRQGPLPLQAAVEVGSDIAAALSAAHERGIVHRDVKPENLFVTREERVKVLDFGLVRSGAVTEQGDDDGSTPTLTRLTEPGTVLGSAGYMAPEQARGEPVDARADIFSLGAVIYEMVTGERAFEGPTFADVLSAVLREDPPPLSDADPVAPDALARIVARCLEKSPARRFQSAADLEFALRELALSSGSTGGEDTDRQRDLSAQVIRFDVAPPEGAMLTGQLALSPEASRLAFVATDADGHDRLWVRPLDALEARVVPETEGAAFPFWSPDGHGLGFFADGKLKRVEPGGFQPPQTLCPAHFPRGGAWSPSGEIVFSTAAGGEVRVVSESGGESRRIDDLVSKRGELYRWPSFLPDGRRFLCQVLSDDPELAGLHLASLDLSSTRPITRADWGGLYAPPGFLLFRVGDQLMCQRFDAERGESTAPARPIVENVWHDGVTTILTACSASANGFLAYQTGGLATSELVWHDRDGTPAGVAGPAGAFFEPELSPDGRRVAVPGIGSTGLGIYLFDSERGAPFPIDTGGEPAATPIWRPDGERLAFSRFPSGEVMVTSGTGRGSPELLFEPEGFSSLDDWSGDGRLIFHTHIDFQTFRHEIRVHDLERAETRTVVSGTYSNGFARLSPDGRWLAYQSEATGIPEIVVQDFPALEERWQVSVGGGSQPRWRRDGSELYYVSPDRKIMALEVSDGESVRFGPPRELFQTRILPLVEARNHYDVTPDGERFLVNSRLEKDATAPIRVIAGWTEAVDS